MPLPFLELNVRKQKMRYSKWSFVSHSIQKSRSKIFA